MKINKEKVSKWLVLVRLSILASILISLGGTVYLHTMTSDKFLGSALFSIGLYGVIFLGANLFTGKVGYVVGREKLVEALIILGVNLIVAVICGWIYRMNYGVAEIVSTKLDKPLLKLFVDSVICGVCIYLAVEGPKQHTGAGYIMTLLGVMVFILVGAEHCIADAFYLGASNTTTWINFGRLMIVALGNSVGSLIIRFLQVGLLRKK